MACIKYVGKSRGKKQFGRRKQRWEDNFKMGIAEVVDWIYLDQNSNH